MLRRLLGCALCAALWVIVAAVAPAAITQEGGVSISPAVVQVGTSQQIPNVPLGDGKLWVTSPSTLTASTFNIGSLPSGTLAHGAVYVQGGTVTANEGIYVGRGGNGRLEVTGGGLASGGAVRIGGEDQANPTSSPQGVAIVDGVGSKLRYSQLFVGASSDGQLYVTGGGTLGSGATTTAPATTATIGRNAGSTGLVVVDGAGSLWQHNNNIAIGLGGAGALRVTGGGVVISAMGAVGGEAPGAVGSILIDGPGSRWSLGNLSLGNQSQYSSGEVVVTNGGMLDQGGAGPQRATVGGSGFGRVVVNGSTSRWIHPNAPVVGSSNGGVGEIILENGTQFTSAGVDLQNGRVLVDGATTRWTSSGQINFGNSVNPTGASVNPTTIELRNGATLNLSNSQTLNIGANGRLLLANGRVTSLNSRGTQVNNGLIQGGGVLQIGPLTNNRRIVVGSGEKLQISGQLSSNGPNAVIEVNNGELEILSYMSTEGSRLIASGATLRASVGGAPSWFGKGTTTFAAGRSRVFGDYSVSTVVANGAEVEFYDRVAMLNDSVMSVAAGGKLTAFGPFDGRGATGAGTVFLENRVRPAVATQFGGDVFLGGGSSLAISVGGSAGGTSLNVQGALSLSGALTLSTSGDLGTPTALLPIARAGELSGVFSSTPAIGASIGDGIRFHGVTYDYVEDEVLVSLTQGLPADFNLDGVQDGADFLTWQLSLGSACEPGMGADATCDGFVDGADLAVWQAATAAASGLQTGVQTGVPEPASLGLSLLAAGAIGRIGRVPRRRLTAI